MNLKLENRKVSNMKREIEELNEYIEEMKRKVRTRLHSENETSRTEEQTTFQDDFQIQGAHPF